MPEFGTSGLRGLAEDLTDELCATYAAAFVSLHAHDGRLFVGQDRRESSPRLTEAVAAGAASQGVTVVDCGVLPTPALAAAAEGTLAIMVTGSHIPADRNGLKFYTAEGEFTKEDEAPLREAVAVWSLNTAAPELVAGTAREDYIARYLDGVPNDSLNGLRVGVWLHSSAAYETLPEILSGLGAEVVPCGPSDTFVPVDTEAVDRDTRAMLAETVRAEGLDAIVSTDGDADRPLLVDDAGKLVPGDILGPITARWCGARTVVTTVSANTLVDRTGWFDDVARTRIGSPYVIAEMNARIEAGQDAVVGYEPNGGFLLGWDLTGEIILPRLMTRDATLPLVATLAATRASGGPLSRLLADLPQRRTASGRLQEVPTEISRAIVAALADGTSELAFEGFGDRVATDTTDGFRMTFDSGRILHIRPSGNAPELRCYVEAESVEAAEERLSDALATLKEAVAAAS